MVQSTLNFAWFFKVHQGRGYVVSGVHSGRIVLWKGDISRKFYTEPVGKNHWAFGKTNPRVSWFNGISDGKGVSEPGEFREEEIFRQLFPKHGLARHGLAPKTLSLQSQKAPDRLISPEPPIHAGLPRLGLINSIRWCDPNRNWLEHKILNKRIPLSASQRNQQEAK